MKIQKHIFSLRFVFQDEQHSWQLNRICSVVTFEDMSCCALKQRSLQLEAVAHKHK